MGIHRSDDGNAAFVRLERGTDLLEGLTKTATELGIEAGTVQLIGAVSGLVIGYFDQDRKEYRKNSFPEKFEIGSGIGNVSVKDGAPFVHVHVIATGPDGSTRGGHLMEGTNVYMVEAYFRALGGTAPVREQDDDIGLAVWR